MARMHSRKKGKSGSKRPLKPAMPTWQRLSAKEVEMLIVKLAKEGKSASEIGIALRDSYGIPSVKLITQKAISAILKEKELSKELPEDIIALMRRVDNIRSHMEMNRQDMTAKRGLQLTESKIRRLVKYHKQAGNIAVDWKYDPKNVRMYTE